MAQLSRKKIFGLALCLTALALAVGGWAWLAGQAPSTDNAYVRGDITSLAPKVAGYVVAVEVADNETVRAGEVLFRIDDADYRARLAQAEANVVAAQARLANIEAETRLQHTVVRQADAQRRASLADLGLAAKASARRRALIESSAVSQAQVDESDAAKDRADAGLSGASATLQAQKQKIDVLATQRDAAAAAIAQAEAARDLARIDLASTVVRAPVAGVVGNRQVRVGRFVTPGVSLVDIVPVGDLWVVANFKETALARIRPGQRAVVTVDGFPGARFQGVVDSYAPGSGAAFSLIPPDNATGNFVRVVQRVPVKVRLARHPLAGRLVPGLSARVEIAGGRGS
ncbi:MAG: HlyD family secretion protein [Alphaproteobacteria bacterium]|nr:HlyD family secretion protein [Alphaproteobacteria bacterium]MBU1516608.1 HlyD family secretion protein [Alphaproteobacteria bacterium]MBU2094364.1 HlyD family secretion protein [Alphaproteobacteria bacterium]MBU2153249.1 HlyD family secretion protein [Alphaproteobacteria bacterium]MBU2307535.1 HlyD family secretion protein [Alphaproteobacteria bacterium]